MDTLMKKFYDENLSNLLEFLEKRRFPLKLFPLSWLKTTDYFFAPASKTFHGAQPGGLYSHSRIVADTLLNLTDKGIINRWSRPESPIIIGLLHDATKIDSYRYSQVDGKITYTKNPDHYVFDTHGYDSVRKIRNHMDLTDEEIACIQFHMGAYDTTMWKEYDEAIHKYPNVLWTHTADMYASKVIGV